MPKEEDEGARSYLRPLGILSGDAAAGAVASGAARPLAGGSAAFTHLEVVRRAGGSTEREIIPVADFSGSTETLDRMTGTRTPLELGRSRLELSAPVVIGIVNVTPDSFSDGGVYFDPDAAIAHGRALVDAGAHILDIGGESTRPGAEPVSVEDEQDRILPVIEGLRDAGVPISVDTRRAGTMAAALKAGAQIINDVSALSHDPESLAVAAEAGVPVVLMHAQGDPRTMQDAPVYDDVLLEVYDYLEERVEAAVAAGIPRHRIIADPGIGFGKTLAHNLALLDGIGIFHGLGCPVMLGASRKSFIGKITGEEQASARVPGSLAVAVLARLQGVQFYRVHDVAETVQALGVCEAVLAGGQRGPHSHR